MGEIMVRMEKHKNPTALNQNNRHIISEGSEYSVFYNSHEIKYMFPWSYYSESNTIADKKLKESNRLSSYKNESGISNLKSEIKKDRLSEFEVYQGMLLNDKK